MLFETDITTFGIEGATDPVPVPLLLGADPPLLDDVLLLNKFKFGI